LADHLIDRGDLDADDRSAVEALVARHLKKHGGDAERSLAAVAAGRSTRENLAQIADADIAVSIGHLAAALTHTGDDANPTASYGVGTATCDGQRFRALRPHARGGIGAVFLALDQELHCEVALKQILDQHADDPDSRQRLVEKAEITGGLEHPGIPPVYGLATCADGPPRYAMRFITGDSLEEATDRFHGTDGGWVERSEANGKSAQPAAVEDSTHPTSDPGRCSLKLREMLRRLTEVCNAVD
jgi:hypothetical protein